jgi:hypothetical protein
VGCCNRLTMRKSQQARYGGSSDRLGRGGQKNSSTVKNLLCKQYSDKECMSAQRDQNQINDLR